MAVPYPDGTWCNQTGQVCYRATCQSGKCVNAVAPAGTPCASGETCLQGGCVGETCVGKPLTGPACADGNPCTLADVCVAGKCAGKPIDGGDCSDGDPCWTGSCVSGECQSKPNNGASCPASGPCWQGLCNGGKCTQQAKDGVPCASPLAEKAPCVQFSCQDGGCLGLGNAPDGSPCSDGNSCTVDACAAGKCKGSPLTGPACDDDNSCTTDACVAGKCKGTFASGATCDDKNPCTADSCQGAVCVHSPISAVQCMQASGCWEAVCLVGECTMVATSGKPCDDGNLCTTADVCGTAGCSGKPADGVVCPTSWPCIVYACKSGKCSAAVNTDGATCDDGTICTVNDTCKGSVCKGKPIDGAACSPDGVCLVGVCLAGACSGTVDDKVTCFDSNPCTLDSCVSGVCLSVPGVDGTDCGSNACKSATCLGGVCKVKYLKGQPCSDGNPCTSDACNGWGGCVGTGVAEGTGCDDANPCSLADTCHNGFCAGVMQATATIGTGATESGTVIAARPGGGWIVGGSRMYDDLPVPGWSGMVPWHRKAWLTAVSPTGQVEWEWTYGKPPLNHFIRALTVMPGGDFALVGEAEPAAGNGDAFPYMARIKPDGSASWAVDLPAQKVWRFKGIAATSTGNLIAVSPYWWPLAVGFSGDGDVLWQKKWDGAPDIQPYAVVARQDVVMVAGLATKNAQTFESMGVIARIDLDGNVLWQKTLPGAVGLFQAATMVDDGVVALGLKALGGNVPVLVRMDLAGNLQWLQAFGELPAVPPDQALTTLGVVPRPGGGFLAGCAVGMGAAAVFGVDAAGKPLAAAPNVWPLTGPLMGMASNGSEVRVTGYGPVGFGQGDAWFLTLDAAGSVVCPK